MEITPVDGGGAAGGLGADLGSGIMLHDEAERLAETIKGFSVQDVGSSDWMKQHETVEKMNLQAHYNARMNVDPFVMEALITFDKLPTLVQELMGVEAWKEFVLPRIRDEVIVRNGLRLYYVHYHEAAIVNLFEAIMYHDYACEAMGEALIDLVDYCARKVQHLVTKGASPAEAKKSREEVVEEIKSLSPEKELQSRLDDIEYRIAVTSVSILRYITEHVSKLPLGVASRLLDVHDVMLMMVPLIENPPWTRRTPEGKWEKFVEQSWDEVPPVDLLKLTKTEGQVWLILFNLMCDKDCRAKYHFNSFRKGNIMRIRKYMNEVLLDQLPILADVQRYLDELAIMDPPAPTSIANTGLVLEQVPALRDALVKGQNWDEVATYQLAHCFPASGDRGDKDLVRLANMYAEDGVADIIDPDGKVDPALLEALGEAGGGAAGSGAGSGAAAAAAATPTATS